MATFIKHFCDCAVVINSYLWYLYTIIFCNVILILYFSLLDLSLDTIHELRLEITLYVFTIISCVLVAFEEVGVACSPVSMLQIMISSEFVSIVAVEKGLSD